MKQIISDIINIPKNKDICTEYIESRLCGIYGEIIRWAIVDVSDENLKICVTYEKEEA